MNKRIIFAIIIIIFLVAAGAGCFGGDEPRPPSGPNFNEETGDYPSDSGWIDSDMGDSPQHIDTTMILDINASEMISEITIQMKFEDADSAHSESDSESDPDEVTISLTNGVDESDPATGTTPCNLEVTLTPNSTEDEENSYLSGLWEIKISAVCNPGAPYTILPRPGQIWAPLTYKDQGVAYTLNIAYSYLVEQ
jgi:hypothetical protein